jgi:hypothetical protein
MLNIEVKPLENYNLQIVFDNGEEKIYDMSNLLDMPFYKNFEGLTLFNCF